jgi:hypothetical protein
MLAVPEQEFPIFPAALPHLLMLNRSEIQTALEQRATSLAEKAAALEASLAGQAGSDLPRIAVLELEYLRTVTAAELTLQSVIDDLRSGRLSWSSEELIAISEAEEAKDL